MDKETLSNYGWIVIAVLVLSVMIALATPFGTFVKNGVENTATGLVETGNKGMDVALSATGVCTHRETEIRNITDTYTGDTYCTLCDTMISAGHIVKPKVPVGGKYTTADGTIYNSGDEIPETVTTGDTYEYGDYTYKYNQYSNGTSWSTNPSQNGWGVRVKDKTKTTYDALFSEIAGQPVNTMSNTFACCRSLTTPPDMSNASNVTNMSYTFYDCHSLTTAPTIPNSVTNMTNTFEGCTSLTTAPTIPNSVTNMNDTFYRCTSLTTVPAIPSSVTYMGSTFSDCTSLTTPPDMSNVSNVTHMTGTFKGCKSITTAPVIPNSVTYMTDTFEGCTSLTTAPTIPNSVKDMFSTFEGCTSLTTAPTIPNSVKDMPYTFKGCTSLTTAPTIPNSVTNMTNTFEGCTSLKGTIEINANPIRYSGCLKNTQITGITGSCSQATKDALMETK